MAIALHFERESNPQCRWSVVLSLSSRASLRTMTLLSTVSFQALPSRGCWERHNHVQHLLADQTIITSSLPIPTYMPIRYPHSPTANLIHLPQSVLDQVALVDQFVHASEMPLGVHF